MHLIDQFYATGAAATQIAARESSDCLARLKRGWRCGRHRLSPVVARLVLIGLSAAAHALRETGDRSRKIHGSSERASPQSGAGWCEVTRGLLGVKLRNLVAATAGQVTSNTGIVRRQPHTAGQCQYRPKCGAAKSRLFNDAWVGGDLQHFRKTTLRSA